MSVDEPHATGITGGIVIGAILIICGIVHSIRSDRMSVEATDPQSQ